MGNIIDELLTEEQIFKVVEECAYHKDRFMSDDGICLKCEDIRGEEE